ncbi:MAG TPA: hypothetical protein VEC99_12190, partial [Clostridia bacterium]|nr:hypothetical protein [Clostridia bacterium]
MNLFRIRFTPDAAIGYLVVKPVRAMGWDAYAVRPGIDPRQSEEEFLTPVLEERFRHASGELAGIVGVVSENLASGTLGGLSMGVLARATGVPDYDETSADGGLLWSPEVVRQAHEQAKWNSGPEGDEPALMHEARLFLDVCASEGLAIWFD